MVTQKRKCECIVEWKRGNRNRYRKPEFMGMEGKVFKGLNMGRGKLVRRHYLKVGWWVGLRW